MSSNSVVTMNLSDADSSMTYFNSGETKITKPVATQDQQHIYSAKIEEEKKDGE